MILDKNNNLNTQKNSFSSTIDEDNQKVNLLICTDKNLMQ